MKHMKKAMVWTIILAMLLSNGGIGVVAETILRLPQALEVIEEEAFYGDNSIDKVELGDKSELDNLMDAAAYTAFCNK